MSSHKFFDVICIAVTVLAVILTVLFMNGESLGLITAVRDDDAEKNENNSLFTDNDLAVDWDESGAVRIALDGAKATVSGGGAYSDSGSVVISSSGRYTVSGSLTDGNIKVDAGKNAKVFIKLCSVDIYCSDDAAIRVDSADKVFLTLAEGSENTLSSGSEYSEEALSDKTDAVLFSHDDLTINGTGTLRVTDGYKHGIAANDDLVITGGKIYVDAPVDGVRANDRVNICTSDIHVTAGDDGIVVAKESGALYIASGTIDINASDDGIHTASDITIDEGEIKISAGDDGIHSDTAITVNSGKITVNKCCEGIEAHVITVNGGEITVYPSEDGLNAGGGTSSTVFPGMRQDGTESESREDDDIPQVIINGGSVTVINESGTDADGIDSNGDILINGGDVYISLNNGMNNTPLDYGSENGGVCRINSGSVIACGSSSMLEDIDSSSEQPTLVYTSPEEISGGSEIKLLSDDGQTKYSDEVKLAFSAVIISSPEIKAGENYTLCIGDTSVDITFNSTVVKIGNSAVEGFNTGGRPAGGFGRSADNNSTYTSGEKAQSRYSKGTDGNVQGTDESTSRSEVTSGTQGGTEFTPPSMPDGSTDIDTPPSMPDGSTDNGAPPSMPDNGKIFSAPSSAQDRAPPGQNGEKNSDEVDDNKEDDEDGTTDKRDLTAEDFIHLAVCFGVLTLGIAFAALYKKRG